MNENLFNEQFEQFWKKAKTRLFDVDANDQEDIKQEIALSVWRAVKKTTINDVPAYLNTAFQAKLKEILYDKRSEAQKANRRKRTYIEMEKSRFEKGCFDTSTLVVRDVVRAAHLTDIESSVFSLHTFSELSYGNIAELLHMSRKAVVYAYSKAKDKIRHVLVDNAEAR